MQARVHSRCMGVGVMVIGKQIEVSLFDRSGPQGKEVDSFYKTELLI